MGLSQEPVEAIIAGRPASFTDPGAQVVYEVAMALADDRIVLEGLYERAVKLLGHERITDMIALMGYYTAVPRTSDCHFAMAIRYGGHFHPHRRSTSSVRFTVTNAPGRWPIPQPDRTRQRLAH